MPAESSETRLRADAQRNRDLIVAAAEEIFQERGAEVPMEDIARAAGVGVGTLYRRFPDRESLIRALALDSFRRVLDDAHVASREEPDAWRALTRFLHTTTGLRLVIQLSVHSSRASVLIGEDPRTAEIRNELLDLLDDLVSAAQQDGSLRPDIGGGDLALLLSQILRGTPGRTGEVAEQASQRYLTLLLDGLQAKPGTPLPGRPVTSDDLRIMRGAR